MTPGISSRLSSPPPAAHPSPPPAAAPSAAATPSHPPSPTLDAFTRLEEKWDQFVVMFHRYKEKTEKELQAAVRLQAAARVFLARRQVQSLRGEKHLAVASRATPWPSSHEQAVVRLQAAVRGFLVRRAVRKLHLLISSSLHQLAACAPNHQVSSILFEPTVEVEIWVCSPPARPKRVVSFIRATSLVLDRPNIRTGWFLLHLSSNVKSAVQLFPWDPGGQEDIAGVQIYILVPQLFCIFVLNNKGKPRCKRLNLKSCQVSLWQLEDELVLKGGGDVMGIIGSERQQPGWDKARE
ncbi:uncharacterized isoform X2 [Zea mays]|nr:uncharacterized protein LOC100193655 isoform X2 [Zea mays]